MYIGLDGLHPDAINARQADNAKNFEGLNLIGIILMYVRKKRLVARSKPRIRFGRMCRSAIEPPGSVLQKPSSTLPRNRASLGPTIQVSAGLPANFS